MKSKTEKDCKVYAAYLTKDRAEWVVRAKEVQILLDKIVSDKAFESMEEKTKDDILDLLYEVECIPEFP